MRLRSLFVAAMLCAAIPSCNKEQLAETVVPDEGVTMRYDLTPGQTFDGKVKTRTTVTTPMGDIVIKIGYEVDLLVTGTTTADGPLLAATLQAITMDVVTPSTIPAAATGFDPKIADSLNGLEFRFNMNTQGKIENMPELPEGQPPQVVAAVGQLMTGLQGGLARLPDEPLKKGESWTKSEDDEDGKRSTQGTFKAFGTDPSGGTVAKLETESTGDVQRERNGETMTATISALSEIDFVTSAGFASRVSRKLRQSSNMADLAIEIEATWTKGAVEAVEVTGSNEVQAVTDPCDADYVGPDPCPADEASEQQAITDPCDADYVGPDPCPADEAASKASAKDPQ